MPVSHNNFEQIDCLPKTSHGQHTNRGHYNFMRFNFLPAIALGHTVA
jgi:hypothetical protein